MCTLLVEITSVGFCENIPSNNFHSLIRLVLLYYITLFQRVRLAQRIGYNIRMLRTISVATKPL